MSIRSEVADLIRSIVPATWNVLSYKPTDSNVGKPSVWIQQSTVSRLRRALDETKLTVTLVEPTRDPETCDDRLEANLDILLDALDLTHGLRRGDATRGVTSSEGGYPGYDIDITLTTTRKKEDDGSDSADRAQQEQADDHES